MPHNTPLESVTEVETVYETETERTKRLVYENEKFAWNKRRNRELMKGKPLRRFIRARAKDQCEICQFGFKAVLNIHHIREVSRGGSSKPRNLILICPNCHSLVHHYGHWRRKRQPHEKSLSELMAVGLTSDQAERLLLIATTNAVVHNDGRVELYIDPHPVRYELLKAVPVVEGGCQ